jgi:hypothetical protein
MGSRQSPFQAYPSKCHIHPLVLQIVSQDNMFQDYGFDMSDRIRLVSIGMALVVTCLFGCVFSTILAVPPYIPFCMYHFPQRHMMCVHF